MMINDELKHYGVKGMKWGIQKDRKRYVVINGRKVPADKFNGVMETKEMIAHKPQKKKNALQTSFRVAKAATRHPAKTIKLEAATRIAAINDPKSATKYAIKNLPSLAFKRRSEFLSALNLYMDEIGDDFGKVNVGKDFFTKHTNDTVDDILKDGTSLIVASMLMDPN